MPLGDIHKKLYNPDSDIDKRVLPDDSFDPKRNAQDQKRAAGKKPPMKSTQDEFWLVENDRADLEDKQHKKKYWKISLIALAVISVLVLAFLGVVKYQESAFSEERIDLKIEGPTEIQSGQAVDYKITLTNRNRVALKNAVLHLSYSPDITLQEASFLSKEGFNNSKIELGILSSQETKNFELKLKAFGPRDKQIYFNAILNYQPENFSSNFEKEAQHPAVIKSSALNISLSAPREVASGEEVELQIIIKNQGAESFSDLALNVDYPEGFIFQKSSVSPTRENRIWKINSLSSGEQQKITFSGTLDGPAGAAKTFKFALGKDRQEGDFLRYDENQTSINVIGQRVDIQQTVNGKTEYYAWADDVLDFSIKFKNNSQVVLRDLILTEKISSPVIDKSQMMVTAGFYDSAAEQIVWKAADVPALKVLEPNQEGEVKFRLRVSESFPMQSEKDKNFVIKSQAIIDSQDVDSLLGQNKKISTKNWEIKVNSKLILEVAGNYNDGELPNTGPIPPKVGQETTFTPRFQIRNTSNNLKNVVLTTTLPAGVIWKNKIEPEMTGVEYNERTNELKWSLGTVDAGTGFLLPVRTLAFQVGVTPSQNQISQNLILLNPIKVTATDSFTNQPVEYKFKSLGTVDIKDIGVNNGTVVP